MYEEAYNSSSKKSSDPNKLLKASISWATEGTLKLFGNGFKKSESKGYFKSDSYEKLGGCNTVQGSKRETSAKQSYEGNQSNTVDVELSSKGAKVTLKGVTMKGLSTVVELYTPNICPNGVLGPTVISNTNGIPFTTVHDRDNPGLSWLIDDLGQSSEDPDLFSGSKTREYDLKGTDDGFTVKKMTHQITWKLRRVKREGLVLESVRFEGHVFPNENTWEESDNQIDGNELKIIASISNLGKVTKTTQVTFKELESGKLLGTTTVSIPPNGTRDAEIIWDTDGYSWTDNKKPKSDRDVEVRITGAAPGMDVLEEEMTIAPRPIILVHGLWSSADTWSNYNGFLMGAHSHWKGCAVGDKSIDPDAKDLNLLKMNTGNQSDPFAQTNTIYANGGILAKYIKAVRTQENAWHVDLVAHSMGGLISRYYISSLMPDNAKNDKPVVRNLVMLGTPNEGSSCAIAVDVIDKLNSYYQATQNLFSEYLSPDPEQVNAIRELSPAFMEAFNKVVQDNSKIKYSVLAGNYFPMSCELDGSRGDGVVSEISAKAWYKNVESTNTIHTAMTTSLDDFEKFVVPRLAIGPTESGKVK
jgi:pimeloyl-ACP methyl ester carboxylesterase